MTSIQMINSVGRTECHDGCGENDFDPEIIIQIQELRDRHWPGRKIIYERGGVGCICRCTKHNKEVGGAPESLHISDKKLKKRCKAADFNIEGVDPHEVRQTIDVEWPYGMEYDTPTWVHLDLRPYRCRFTK